MSGSFFQGMPWDDAWDLTDEPALPAPTLRGTIAPNESLTSPPVPQRAANIPTLRGSINDFPAPRPTYRRPVESGFTDFLQDLFDPVLGPGGTRGLAMDLTERSMGLARAAGAGLGEAKKDFRQTYETVTGGDYKRPEPAAPQLFQPLTLQGAWDDPRGAAEKVTAQAARFGVVAASAAGGALAAMAAAPATASAGAVAGVALLGSAGAAGLSTLLQVLGTNYEEAIKLNPDDSDAAYWTAVKLTAGDTALGAAGGLLGGVNPFSTVLKNLLAQTFVVQPSVGVVQSQFHADASGQESGLSLADEYFGATVAGLPMAAVGAAVHPGAAREPWALPRKQEGDGFHIAPNESAVAFQKAKPRALGRSPLDETVTDRTEAVFNRQFAPEQGADPVTPVTPTTKPAPAPTEDVAAPSGLTELIPRATSERTEATFNRQFVEEPKLQRAEGLARTPQDVMSSIRDNADFEKSPDAVKQEIADYYQRLRNGEEPKAASETLSDPAAEILGRPPATVDGKRIADVEMLTPDQERQHTVIINNFRSVLSEIAPRAMTKVFARIDKGGAKGAYFTTPEGQSLIGMALESNEGPNTDSAGTGWHEGGHWLLDNVATKPEANAIFDLAEKSGWRDKHNIEARYPNKTEAQKTEEAVVEEFRAGRSTRWEGYPKLVRAPFLRFHGLLTKIAIAARRVVGKDATGEQVMKLMRSGAMGRRKSLTVDQRRQLGRLPASKSSATETKFQRGDDTKLP